MSKQLEVVAEPGGKTIVTRRWVEAPPALVWDCFTRLELLEAWLRPSTMTLTVGQLDVRPGGKWRFEYNLPDGGEMAFWGEFGEVSPPRKLTRSFIFSGAPDHPAQETLTLSAMDGGTLITTLTEHGSTQGRDGHLASGAMERGMTEHYARMDELVARLQK